MADKVTFQIIDVAQDAIKAFGREVTKSLAEATGGEFKEHDYRFEALLPNGAVITFNSDATAEYVEAYLKDEVSVVQESTLFKEHRANGS